ncbi:hypothetical protein DPMN_105636 [Dreissena polymorpha]|uniref:Uncharacterized protein n=1 Tax=Dreissena polymorpha TaxID=45954 RepID=A0A9D4EMN9_DREPO|nr:hypothetical protein DPMN_161015 [Dreissena polymorpha]KAH3832351.1 hypothetical protein DPMN_105636 [Dreissena polymorpha]
MARVELFGSRCRSVRAGGASFPVVCKVNHVKASVIVLSPIKVAAKPLHVVTPGPIQIDANAGTCV